MATLDIATIPEIPGQRRAWKRLSPQDNGAHGDGYPQQRQKPKPFPSRPRQRNGGRHPPPRQRDVSSSFTAGCVFLPRHAVLELRVLIRLRAAESLGGIEGRVAARQRPNRPLRRLSHFRAASSPAGCERGPCERPTSARWPDAGCPCESFPELGSAHCGAGGWARRGRRCRGARRKQMLSTAQGKFAWLLLAHDLPFKEGPNIFNSILSEQQICEDCPHV